MTLLAELPSILEVHITFKNGRKDGRVILIVILFGTLAHIPSVSLFCNPWTVAMFHTIPEQGKNWTPKQSIPEQHGLFAFNPNFNP
jgi:hypothetical protein